MSTVAARTDSPPAARLLTQDALASLLNRHRLPHYRAIGERLEAYYWTGKVTCLWRELFDELPGNLGLFDLLTSFAARVDEQCFPLDLHYMDAVYNCDGDAIEAYRGPLPYYGYGVAWAVEPFCDLPAAAKPMVAMLYPYVSASYEDFEAVIDWWHDHEQTPPDYNAIEWPNYYRRAVRCLELLDTPFDGLAALYECVRGDSGNPFLDSPDMMWRYEYQYGDYYWDLEDIRQLQRAYGEVRERLEDLQVYLDWYDEQGEYQAGRQVAELLLSIEGRNW